MATRILPTPEELRQLLRYDPESGKLYWLPRPVEMFRDGKRGAHVSWKIWNTTCANKEAFTSTRHDGYKIGAIFGTLERAHRVAWAMHHGEWPTGHVDHIDGNPENNRISNLRHVTREQNMRNARKPTTNKSGCVGVCYDNGKKRWRATIWADGKQKYLGNFEAKFDAVLARLLAEKALGYTYRHGT